MGVVKRQLRHSLHRALGPFGVNRYRPRVPRVTEFGSPLEAVYSQRNLVFEVPVAKCRTNYHVSYEEGGWHPFVQTLRQYLEDPATTYGTSVLRRYYESHRPERMWDVYFPGGDESSRGEGSKLKDLGTDTYIVPNPWDERLAPIRGEGRFDASHGVQCYGPVSKERGQWEFTRLITVLHSIQLRGYRPTADPDGEIRGYFLRFGSDYRFFVRAGFHRMATLAALGRSTVRVRFKSNYPRMVDLKDVDHWPLVKGGLIEKSDAIRISRRYFTDDGTWKARALDLL